MQGKHKTKNTKLGFVYCLVSILYGFFFFSCSRPSKEILADNEYYTCSMDPQVLEKQAGRCPICKMELSKIILDKKQMHSLKLSTRQIMLGNIKADTVKLSSIGKETMLAGVFAVNQNQTEQLSARIQGRIDKLYHKVIGETITAGEPIYDLYSREFMLAQEELLITMGMKTGIGNNMFVSTKKRLLLLGMTSAQIAELEKTKKPKITLTVFSKSSGTITDIPVKEGESVAEGTTIYKLANLNYILVEAQLYSNEIRLLNKETRVEVIPYAFPDEIVEGTISFSNPELQFESKINLIRIEVNNSQGKFKPGMQANVILHSEEKKAITLPADAVIRDAHYSVVWIQNKKNEFEPRTVETGIENKFRIEIKSGLSVGEKVVTSGAYLINSEYIFRRGMMPTHDRKEM